MVVQLSTASAPASDVLDTFLGIAERVVWCSVATVDRRDRPRSRVMHPVWERTDSGLVGWATARRTALKLAHLAHRPYVSCSYWDPTHDIAVAECDARWVDDPSERAHAIAHIRAQPEPYGFDPDALGDVAFLRFDPWRLRAATAAMIPRGEAAVWRREAAA